MSYLPAFQVPEIVSQHVATTARAAALQRRLITQQPLARGQGRSQDFEFRGLKPMASAKREPITGVWGQSPQLGRGAEPLVGGQGGEALLKLEGF